MVSFDSFRVLGALAFLATCSLGCGDDAIAPIDSGPDSSADAGPTVDANASADARPDTDAGMGTDAGPIEAFTVHPGTIFAGQFEFLAVDPSVVGALGDYRMYYTCYATDISGTETCLATSPDGLTWTNDSTGGGSIEGRVLHAMGGQWDGAHETPFAVQRGGETWLYFIGYADAAAGFLGNPISLGVATSPDGRSFGAPGAPILSPAPSTSYDHGFTSPSVLPWSDGWALTFTAWCLEPTRCPRIAAGRYVDLMGATSEDGRSWTVDESSIFNDDLLPAWAPNGIAETHVFEAPDDSFALLFTALDGDEPMVLGLATGPTPFGPWAVHSNPLFAASEIAAWAPRGAVAPHGRVEGDRLRIWFAGQGDASFRIGYAEGAWPPR